MPFLPPPDPAIEIVLASKGMSKGLSQTEGAQLVARGELAFDAFFLTALAKNLTAANTEGELQFGAGGRLKLGGFDVTLSASAKRWVDTTGDPDKAAAEFNASASRAFGKITPRMQVIYSPDDLGSTTHSVFAEAGLGWKVHPKLLLSANVGTRQRGGGPDYVAGNLGAALTIHRNLTAELRYYDTNKSNLDEPFEDRVVTKMSFILRLPGVGSTPRRN